MREVATHGKFMTLHWPSRALAAALVCVLVGMAAFAVWQRNEAASRLTAIDHAQSISDAYSTAHVEIIGLEKALILWGAEPGPAMAARAGVHAQATERALRRLAAVGDEEDRAFANALIQYGEDVSPLLTELLSAPDPDLTYNRLLPEMDRLYDQLIARLDPDLFAAYDSSPSQNWTTVSPIAALLEQRSAEERATVSALMSEVGDSWEGQTPWVLAVYALGTALVVALLASTMVIGKREARARAEIEALRLAVTTDPLTGLGNRRGFEETLKTLTASPQLAGAPLSLAILDLDEFKEANDTFGHDRGDAILRAFADVLRNSAPASVRTFRIGGDEFALVMPGIDGPTAMTVANAVRLRARSALENGITVSAGVAVLADDETLLRQQADAALYEAKLRGRNLAVLYHDDGNSTPLFPAAKLAAVRQLLVEGKVKPLFQPIWDIHESRLLAYEGLSRPDERYGLAGPQQAFEIAEKFGRAADLDRICRLHILEAAASLPPEADLFINLSPYTLSHQSFDPAHLIGEVLKAGIDPGRVVFEVTERSQLAPDAVAEGVSRLRQAGFRVALDDVGAGNNGLEMLRKVSVDFVKVDREVVLAAQESGPGRAALMAILAFSAESGALVVAEGVEDEGMFGLVKEVAHLSVRGTPGLIHGVQGYLFGRPTDALETLHAIPAPLAA